MWNIIEQTENSFQRESVGSCQNKAAERPVALRVHCDGRGRWLKSAASKASMPSPTIDLPRGISQKTRDHVVFAAESFSFLLAPCAKVSYPEFASMIRGYSADPRAQFLSDLLESFGN